MTSTRRPVPAEIEPRSALNQPIIDRRTGHIERRPSGKSMCEPGGGTVNARRPQMRSERSEEH